MSDFYFYNDGKLQLLHVQKEILTVKKYLLQFFLLNALK